MKKLLQRYKNEALIFSLLCSGFFVLFFFKNGEICSDTLYPLHLIDLRAGFISRTLIGGIIGLIWERPTKANVVFFLIAANIFSFALISVFLGKCINKAKEQDKKPLLVFSAVIAVFPYSFISFINLFDLLDIFYLTSAALCLLSAENKKFYFLIPVFIVTGLWAHYGFLFAFMPLIYILCINLCVREKSRLSRALLAVMAVTSVGFAVYFLLTGRNLKIPFDEFSKIIIAKAGDKITQFESYVGSSFAPLKTINDRYSLVDRDIKWTWLALIVGNFKYNFKYKYYRLAIIFTHLLLISPAFVFFEKIWQKSIKKTEDKKEKFVILLCAISPLVQIAAVFLSTDASRWLSKLVISQFLLLAIFLSQRNENVSEAFNELYSKIERHKTAAVFVVCLYLSVVFDW